MRHLRMGTYAMVAKFSSTMPWDQVAASTAVDRTSARVTGRGVHWESQQQLEDFHVWSDVPLPVLPLPSGTPDMTGLRVDRLVVIGYGGSANNGTSGISKWVVRCACGGFEYRRGKTLRKMAKNPRPAMCQKCNYLEHIKYKQQEGRGR